MNTLNNSAIGFVMVAVYYYETAIEQPAIQIYNYLKNAFTGILNDLGILKYSCNCETEDLTDITNSCDIETGVKCTAYIATVCAIDEMTVNPPPAATVFNDIIMNVGETFKEVGMIVNSGSFNSPLAGNTGNTYFEPTATFEVAGLSQQLLRNLSILKNKGVVIIICDNSGNYWVVGTEDNPLYMDTASNVLLDGENNKSTLAFKGKDCVPLRLYTGILPI